MQRMMGLMRRCIDDYRMIEPNDKITVGVSGGKDSLTLLTLLAALRDAGVALGIISNKTETTSQRIAAHFFPDLHFRMVWGNNGERPLKPAADAGQLACAQLGLPAGAVAYVGDSDVDMRFAQQSGFLAVGAAWGYRGAEELTAAGADGLCADAGALLARLRDALPALR